MATELAPLVEEYRSLYETHGFLGAYEELARRHSAEESFPTHEELMAAHSPYVLHYAFTLDHRFTAAEEAAYRQLQHWQRTAYDNLRWFMGYSHELAWLRAARLTSPPTKRY